MPTTPRTRKSGLDLPDEPAADLPDEPTDQERPQSGLALLRAPFPPEAISKLPRITCPDCREKRCSRHSKQRCDGCKGYLTTGHIHLDYVGHAEATGRLLDADPGWTWEPLAVGPDGLPLFDRHGGLWIRLTVCGVTRLGYGDAGEKRGGDAIKECIGDAIRNAGMRFGVALALWAKSDLHGRDQQTADSGEVVADQPTVDVEEVRTVQAALLAAGNVEEVRRIVTAHLAVMPVTVQIEGLGEGTLAQLAEYVTAQKTAAAAVEAQPVEPEQVPTAAEPVPAQPAVVEEPQPSVPTVPGIPEEERKPLPSSEVERFTLGLDDAVEGRLPGKGGGKRRTGAPYEDRLAYLSTVEKWARAHVPKEQIEEVLLPKLDQAMATVISYINDDQRQAAEAAR